MIHFHREQSTRRPAAAAGPTPGRGAERTTHMRTASGAAYPIASRYRGGSWPLLGGHRGPRSGILVCGQLGVADDPSGRDRGQVRRVPCAGGGRLLRGVARQAQGGFREGAAPGVRASFVRDCTRGGCMRVKLQSARKMPGTVPYVHWSAALHR
jgi:hypothetical protein